MSDSERDDIIKRGGNPFENGYAKAKGEFFEQDYPYPRVLKGTRNYIRRFWKAPPGKEWTQVQEKDAVRLIDIAYDEYLAYKKK